MSLPYYTLLFISFTWNVISTSILCDAQRRVRKRDIGVGNSEAVPMSTIVVLQPDQEVALVEGPVINSESQAA